MEATTPSSRRRQGRQMMVQRCAGRRWGGVTPPRGSPGNGGGARLGHNDRLVLVGWSLLAGLVRPVRFMADVLAEH
jgi:hypothetical protein